MGNLRSRLSHPKPKLSWHNQGCQPTDDDKLVCYLLKLSQESPPQLHHAREFAQLARQELLPPQRHEVPTARKFQ